MGGTDVQYTYPPGCYRCTRAYIRSVKAIYRAMVKGGADEAPKEDGAVPGRREKWGSQHTHTHTHKLY